MNKLIFLCSILLTLTTTLNGQTKESLPFQGDEIIYERSFDLNNIDKIKLLNDSKRWLIKNNITSQNPFLIDAPATGELIARCYNEFPAEKKSLKWVPFMNVEYLFQLTIDKDKFIVKLMNISKVGKYEKITLEKLNTKNINSRDRFDRKQWEEMIIFLNKNFNSIIDKYYNYIIDVNKS